MDTEEFQEFAKTVIDYLGDYFETIRERPALSDVEPGYLSQLLPQRAPEKSEKWQVILKDMDSLIMPGLTHWHSPFFHAYYPTANSYTGIVGELFMAGLGTIATNWESNPACVELEMKMMDWLVKILGLPKNFMNSFDSPGGGALQNAASDSTVVGILSGKHRKIKELKSECRCLEEWEIRGKLVAYTSTESNSSVEKSGLLASIKMQLIPTDKHGSLRGDALAEAVAKDKEKGLIPFAVVATLGTTGTCAFDDLDEIGKICKKEKMWLHVDAAYAGAALSCPEFRLMINGIEYVDTFNFNPHKWFLTNSDCSAMWFKNTNEVEEAFKIQEKQYFKSQYPHEPQHWQIPEQRRFRALKLWFVIRSYGVEGIQKYHRHQVALAKHFEGLVREDKRFKVVTSSLGVVCFKLLGEEKLTKNVFQKISERRKLFIMPYAYQDQLLFRFVICSRLTEYNDVEESWKEISWQTTEVLKEFNIKFSIKANMEIVDDKLRIIKNVIV